MPKRTSQTKINWLSATYFSTNLISIHQISCAFLSDRHVSLLPLLLIISVSLLNVAHNDDVLMIRWNVMQNMFTNQYPVTPGSTLSNSCLISFVHNTVQILYKLFNLKKIKFLSQRERYTIHWYVPSFCANRDHVTHINSAKILKIRMQYRESLW